MEENFDLDDVYNEDEEEESDWRSLISDIALESMTSEELTNAVFTFIAELVNKDYSNYIKEHTFSDYTLKTLEPINFHELYEKARKGIMTIKKEDVKHITQHLQDVLTIILPHTEQEQLEFFEEKSPSKYPAFLISIDIALTFIRILALLTKLGD